MWIEIPETRFTRRVGLSFAYAPKALLSIAFWVSEDSAPLPKRPWAMLLASMGRCDDKQRVFIARHWF